MVILRIERIDIVRDIQPTTLLHITGTGDVVRRLSVTKHSWCLFRIIIIVIVILMVETFVLLLYISRSFVVIWVLGDFVI